MDDLTKSPRWRESDLGQPLPNSPHATSTAMPLWSHVVGYEKGDPAITGRLQCGYPRFFRHPAIGELLEDLGFPPERSLPLPSLAVARRAAAFVAEQCGEHAQITDAGRSGMWVVSVSQQAYPSLWAYWQHTGEIVSSRQASAALARRASGGGTSGDDQVRAVLAQRVAALARVPPTKVWLYPTGMAAAAAVFRVARALAPTQPTVQFGFSYVDTLRLQQKMGAGVEFLPAGDARDLDTLAGRIDQLRPAAVFCECPTNPLLKVPDLAALSDFLRPRGIPLVVDNTIDSFYHLAVVPHADVVVTSLTKSFSSVGDVMGGSLVVNPDSPLGDSLSERLNADFEPLLFVEDAAVLTANGVGFRERMARIDTTTRALVAHLQRHHLVAHVWYCGFGGLFSMEPVGGEPNAAVFYDRLRCTKGPSLGTNFTLVCPYTLLAHFDELEWTKACGVSPNLLRVSVGLECADELIARFDQALSWCR